MHCSYNTRLALRIQRQLRTALGGVCQHCGSTGPLQFDYRVPVNDGHHALGFLGRMVAYRRAHRIGNLGLLCAECHAAKNPQDWVMTHLPAHDRNAAAWCLYHLNASAASLAAPDRTPTAWGPYRLTAGGWYRLTPPV